MSKLSEKSERYNLKEKEVKNERNRKRIDENLLKRY